MKLGISFKDALVVSGTKSVNEAYPELILTSSNNGFRINRRAAKEMEVGEGDRVIMFDAKHTGATDENDRYYVGKEVVPEGGWTDEVKPQGAKIGKSSLSYNYSGIYGCMLANDFDIPSITAEELIAKGLMIKRTTKNDEGQTFNSYLALKTGSAELVPFADGEPVDLGDGVEMKLWVVSNLRLTDHDPKVMKKDGEEETTEETQDTTETTEPELDLED